MRIPRDIGGEELARRLGKYGYSITRQTGSHLRLTTEWKGRHHITVPRHKPLKVGTLNNILGDVAEHVKEPKESLTKNLFG